MRVGQWRGIEPTDHRLITEATARDIVRRLETLHNGDGWLQVGIQAWWRGSLRWARNRVSLASDQRDVTISITRRNKIGQGMVNINQIDEASLTAAMHAAERKMNFPNLSSLRVFHDGLVLNPEWLPYPDTAIWSEATFNVLPEQRAALAQALTDGSEAQQLMAAGFLSMSVWELYMSDSGVDPQYDRHPVEAAPRGTGGQREARVELPYVRWSTSECSMTVRHPKGMGSGWAGLSGYDWAVIDAAQIANRALDKCVQSLNPVAIEPGRYTVILEPQAVEQLVARLIRPLQLREMHEYPHTSGEFSLDLDPTLGIRMTKIGLQVIDERISISHDPMDPRLGIIPKLGLRPVTWIEHGVLKTLGTKREEYTLPKNTENLPDVHRFSFSMTGGTTTMEEMIETTKRGIIVTRFSGVADVPGGKLSMLMTGLTRDGLWLVENGRISKSIKNMRFTDSPMFVLNQVEQLGVPVPVFRTGLAPAVVPPVKSRDFAFTATIDAI